MNRRAFFRILACCTMAGTFGFAGLSRAQDNREGRLLPDPDSALIVTVAGDDVEFTWQSKPNRTYLIMASDRASGRAPWNAIPGVDPVKGDGSRINIRVRIPNAQQYRYSLRTFAPAEKKPWWRR